MLIGELTAQLLGSELTPVVASSNRILKDELADLGAGVDGEGDGAGVIHLQELMIRYPGVHEAGGDVNQKTQAGEAASPFQAAADIVRKRDLLHGHAHGRLAREHQKIVLHIDLFGDLPVIGFIGDVIDIPHLLVDHEGAPQVEVYRTGADLTR